MGARDLQSFADGAMVGTRSLAHPDGQQFSGDERLRFKRQVSWETQARWVAVCFCSRWLLVEE